MVGRHFQKMLRGVASVHDRQMSLFSDVPAMKIGVLGVPFGKGQSNNMGVCKGPEALRVGGLLQELIALGHNVRDFGNVCLSKQKEDSVQTVAHNNINYLAEIASCNHEISGVVSDILASDSRALVIGGDHSIVVGTLDGHIRTKGDVGLVYIDAHADLNTADTSPSGNIHGMSVALLVRELYDYWPYLPGMDWQKPVLPASNIVYIGLRSVDKFERLLLDKYSITAFGMAEVEEYGIHKVTEMALDKVDPKGTRSLHVSFDIDALDTLEAPSTGVPVRGGLTLRESIHIMEIVHKTGRMNVMDVVEVNPSIGSPKDVEKTVSAAIHVIRAAYGFSRLGNNPNHVSDIPGKYPSFTEPEKT